MEVGLGLDQGLGLSLDEEKALVAEAARLGYQSAWTPAGLERDAFHTCVQWWQASGLPTGISVVPVTLWAPPSLASTAATVSLITGGRFTLGIGSGTVFARTSGPSGQADAAAPGPVGMMREHLTVLRRLLDGEIVDHDGPGVSLRRARLALEAPRVPLYLAALGPRMLRAGGALADGVALNWSTPEHTAWSRDVVAQAARRAGRDPRDVRIIQYVRVSVDDDVDAARGALARATLRYALAQRGRPRDRGYRAHFTRLGFDRQIAELEALRERGAGDDELAERFPAQVLERVGHFGRAAGAGEAFRRLAEGLDLAIVRVVAARPGTGSAAAVLRACAPGPVGPAEGPERS